MDAEKQNVPERRDLTKVSRKCGLIMLLKYELLFFTFTYIGITIFCDIVFIDLNKKFLSNPRLILTRAFYMQT